MVPTLTREQAEQALAAIADQFAEHCKDHDGNPVGPQPQLIQNWDWLDSGPTPWAIVWEEGPHEWALRAGTGGVDPEAAEGLAGLFGGSVAANATARELATDPPARLPDGVSLEPVTSWAVGLYPA